MRKLASVQEVSKIEPIEGADRIEKATVEGWNVVVPKGQFKEGDKGVFFEIDSFLPNKEIYSFLKNSFKENPILGKGYRIKTAKLRGVFSQGLLMKLDELGITASTPIGMDLTKILDVKEWEVPERATTGGTTVGTLPYSIHKTDETRYQTYPEWKEEFKNLPYYISTKMDGTSCSVSIDEKGFHVCGHNYEYKDDGNSSFYKFIKEKGFKDKLIKYFEDHNLNILSVQGEYCGSGICGNKMKLKKPDWFVFTVEVNGDRTDLKTMLDLCNEIGAEHVPIEEIGEDLPSIYPTDEALQERSDGQYYNDGKEVGRKEGIVIRPIEPVRSKALDTYLSMKVVNNKYLLKKE